MFGFKRIHRPIELGPYPQEKLSRDPSVYKKESEIAPSFNKDLSKSDTDPLNRALWAHMDAYKELRTPEPFSKKAPVPDDLAIRTRDIKGCGYFLDASLMGICKIPGNAWRDNMAGPHSHAVVVIVEHSDDIDHDNLAAKWVYGNEALSATLRAAEIALQIAGQIASLGYSASTHWAGVTDVDLDKLTVLSGLGIRKEDSIINPYRDGDFAVSVVTTDYTLNCDLPLHGSEMNGRGLSYFFGFSGAVSGLERWRRKNRPSHLGPYPVEQLKRVDKPTTLIFEDEVPRVPSRANFYVRSALGDLGNRASREINRWAQKHPVTQGIVRPMWALKPLQLGETADQDDATLQDPDANNKALKALSYYLGSSVTGICTVPDYCWYSHDKHGHRIDPYHKNALVVLIDQGYETFLGACGNDWISGSQSMRAYMRGAEVVGVMAEHIRQMGFSARAHTSLDSHVLHVPLVLLAGLGEQSRIGESALNPFLGMRFKTAVLTTDMPLSSDKPVDFGLQTFCSKCLKCARECPCQAIPFGDKVIFNGYETWKPDSERCTSYRTTNVKGSGCGRCIKTCPLSKDTTWDGPLLHRAGSWLGINALWLKPVLAPIAIWLDDVLGNGNPIKQKKWWLDMEVVGSKSFKYTPQNYTINARAANNQKIDPKKKVNLKRDIAYYPASTLPPPDLIGPYPTDRKKAVAMAAEIETVEQALERRARGGEPPEMYTPSYVTENYKPPEQKEHTEIKP